MFKEEDLIEILKILSWIENIQTRNYLIEEINRNEFMSKRHKKVCTTSNYIERFLILGSTCTGCISNSSFASIVSIPVGITRSATELKICAITVGIENYKSIIKKKKKKHDKIVLLAKSKINSTEVLISKPLIDSVVSHDEFVLIK